MTPQPMYYRDLIGYPPAPAASVQIELIHVDVMTAMQANGWRFFFNEIQATPTEIKAALNTWHSHFGTTS